MAISKMGECRSWVSQHCLSAKNFPDVLISFTSPKLQPQKGQKVQWVRWERRPTQGTSCQQGAELEEEGRLNFPSSPEFDYYMGKRHCNC